MKEFLPEFRRDQKTPCPEKQHLLAESGFLYTLQFLLTKIYPHCGKTREKLLILLLFSKRLLDER